MNKGLYSIIFASLACVVCGSCSGGRPQSGLRELRLRSGETELVVELARSPSEQETGLMYRKTLPEGRGMLFVYESDQKLAYWMKNTYVPLSIAYINSDGIVKEIYDMKPLSLASVPSRHYVRYALEVPQGWFEKAGIWPGSRFDMSAVGKAE